MKLPTELGDEYINNVLSNTLLIDLPDEEWELIKDFENYAISNYGRVKSLERAVINSYGRETLLPERIMKLQTNRYYNNYLKSHFYAVKCGLFSEGKSYGKSVARLVYYHFVEKFDMDDLSFLISFKDDNRFNVHFSNLEKLTVGKLHSKTLNTGRGKKGNYKQAVSQYTDDGKFVASYKNIYEASEALGIYPPHILSVLNKKKITSGKFLWFEKGYKPTEKDFIPKRKNKSEKILNTKLWETLEMPEIDENNPPACMNLSLQDLPGETWKPLPDLEENYLISNKGRIKRLNAWTQNTSKTFWPEQIISLSAYKSDNKKYFLRTRLTCNGKVYNITITRMLYYCFIKEFDIKNRNLLVTNESDPHWDIDIAKLTLESSTKMLGERNKKLATQVRTVFNSKEIFNHSLWEKLGKPKIDKKNPPAIFDLSLEDLPDEHWKPLPGVEGKYAISNKGRVKRLSGWGSGILFFGEDQIVSLLATHDKYPKLYFNQRIKRVVNRRMLLRLLYFCFVKEFDLNDTTLRVISENEHLWEIDFSKLSLRPMAESFRKK